MCRRCCDFGDSLLLKTGTIDFSIPFGVKVMSLKDNFFHAVCVMFGSCP